MLHFEHNISHIDLPKLFTYPFHYTPHPLCVIAAEELQSHIAKQLQWKNEIEQGKMFGVLVVATESGELGYLAAFSGNLNGSNTIQNFVPPIYDMLQPDGFFKIEEENISNINKEINKIQLDVKFAQLKEKLEETKKNNELRLQSAKLDSKRAKEIRQAKRNSNISDQERNKLVAESQYQKAELKRLERKLTDEIDAIQAQVDLFTNKISLLKQERKERSAKLQTQIFKQFKVLNALGETRDLCEIFEQTTQCFPPAGAGECAAPKLLQSAYLNHLKPIAMAEFWLGSSPKREVRHSGHYYPACKGKCAPILKHMLTGLNVEPNPLANETEASLEVVFEDDWLLIVNKPAGMLSVPGKESVDSAYDIIRRRMPTASGPLIVHRLDMATSGLLIFAKNKEIHKQMQAQFEKRTIKKRYIAILDGCIAANSGTINLPICANHLDRPRQMVDFENGKEAVTEYTVLERTENSTRICFRPLSGRTHQLRLHAAHQLGLNAPIKGDLLYGHPADRLYLHAQFLQFVHPVTNDTICVEKDADF